MNTKAGPIPVANIIDRVDDINPVTFLGEPVKELPSFTPSLGVASQPPAGAAPGATPPGNPAPKAGVAKKPVPKKTIQKMVDDSVYKALVSVLQKNNDTFGQPYGTPHGSSLKYPVGSVDNTGGPGVRRSWDSRMLEDDDPDKQKWEEVEDKYRPKPVQMPESEDLQAVQALKALKQWKVNSINRIKKGSTPRYFDDAPIPEVVKNLIWKRLSHAATVEHVVDIFQNPFDDPDLRKELSRDAGGILVRAKDTGRVLLVQRSPDKADDKGAFARWEAPGGKLDGGVEGGSDPSVWAGAVREWQEETGAKLPLSNVTVLGGWISDEKNYEGFIVEIPSEADIRLNPDTNEVTTAAWRDLSDLTGDDIRDKLKDQFPAIFPVIGQETTDD
ncbi:MAG: NUDIX hydrolase [Candidatus Parvarchaeum sp.]